NAKVHEAMVSKVRGDKWRPTGFGPSNLVLFPNPLLSAMTQAAFEDLRTNFSEKYRKVDQVLISRGQPARVRIDAFPDRMLKGHGQTVATMAPQTDWMSSDVKVYQTMVAIDEPMDGLKPGMSAEVTVQTDTNLEHVLTIPLQAIVGGIQLGS